MLLTPRLSLTSSGSFFLFIVVFLMFSFIVFRSSTERSWSFIILSVDSIQDPEVSLLMMCVMHTGSDVSDCKQGLLRALHIAMSAARNYTAISRYSI